MKALALGLALCACSSVSAEPVNTPSGRPGYTVTCEDPTDCYAEAGRLCSRGYDVLDSGQSTEDQHMANALSTTGSLAGAQPQRYTKTKTHALIECR